MRKTADVNGEKRAKSQSGPARLEQTNAGTPDLLHAMQALYQLSYSPSISCKSLAFRPRLAK